MAKLENIPKKDVFEAPEGYFDTLPGIVQARVASPRQSTLWFPVLRLAAAAVVIGLGTWFFMSPSAARTPEEIIASIDSGDLVAYLADSDLSTEELMEQINLDSQDLQDIEDNSMTPLYSDDSLLMEYATELEFKN